jgi:hypothetical protein
MYKQRRCPVIVGGARQSAILVVQHHVGINDMTFQSIMYIALHSTCTMKPTTLLNTLTVSGGVLLGRLREWQE